MALCVFFAIVQHVIRSASRQRIIVEDVQISGGFAFYDFQCKRDSSGSISGYGLEPGVFRQLLIDWLGIDSADRVVLITYYTYTVPPEAPIVSRRTLEAIAMLESLEELDVCGIQSVDDSVIDVLARMQQLRHLCVARTSITASGISRLRLALPKTDIIGNEN